MSVTNNSPLEVRRIQTGEGDQIERHEITGTSDPAGKLYAEFHVIDGEYIEECAKYVQAKGLANARAAGEDFSGRVEVYGIRREPDSEEGPNRLLYTAYFA